MAVLNLDNIKKSLKKKNMDAQVQQETQQVYTILNLDGKEFPLFIRIYEQGDLLQLLAFLPFQLKKDTLNDVSRLLHLFNKELDIPGFGMDETSEVAFFRCMIPALDSTYDEKLLESYLDTIQTACQTFSTPIEAIAMGTVAFDDILKKIQEASPQ